MKNKTILQLLLRAYAIENLYFTEAFLMRDDNIKNALSKRASCNFRIVKNYIQHALKNNQKINFDFNYVAGYMLKNWHLYNYSKNFTCWHDLKIALN